MVRKIECSPNDIGIKLIQWAKKFECNESDSYTINYKRDKRGN